MLFQNKKEDKAIPLLIFLIPIISVVFTAVLILAISYKTLDNFYNQQKGEIKKEFFDQLRKNTKKRVEIAYAVLDTIYKVTKDKNKTLQAFRSLLDEIRWGKGGYIFVYDFQGNTIYHPNHTLIGKNRWNLKRNGKYVLQDLTNKALAKPEGTYIEYEAYNPFGGKPSQKVSYLKVYKPLGIFLGSGVYLDSLDKELLKKQEQFKELFMKLVYKILDISLIVVLMVIILTAFVSFYVKKIFRDYETILKKEREKFYQKSITDKLTGLYNRRYFSEIVEQYLNLSKRENKNLGIAFLDLDNFKEINDTLGHNYGDKILQVISHRLKNVLRKSDIVARFGGDEFVIAFYDYKEIDDIDVIIQKILDNIKQPIKIEDEIFEMSASIGVALYPKDGDSAGQLIKNADAAMYTAKKKKTSFEFFTREISEEFRKKVEFKKSIKQAIKNMEFIPYFQPQIDKNEKLYGSEVLVRWKKDDKIIYPNDFIPQAIEMGFIDKIDMIVIENSLIQWKKWEAKGYNPGVISCNITMQHVEKTDFLSFIKELLAKYDFNPEMLNIEITEQSIMKNPEESVRVFEKIRELGVGVNIDDFGTGYSSLSYLKKLPVDKLKIDKSFIDGVPFERDDVTITTVIIDLAKKFDLKIVAEGVEEKIQRDFLIERGCDYIQGYYYSKPLSSYDFEEKYLKGENDS